MHEAAGATSAAEPREGGDLLCGACGYNLRGSPSDRCAECGQQFDANHLVGNLVPWEQRKWAGRVRAFFRTAWMGTVRPGKLAEKINRPVNPSAARWFRIWVCLVTAAALGAGSVWWRSEASIHTPTRYQQLYLESETALWVFVLNPYSFAVVVAAIIIWLIACINVVSSFFYSKHLSPEQQKRIAALSAYTCAPFAWLPIALPVCAWSIAINSTANPIGILGNSILILCWLALVAQSVSWLRANRRGKLTRTDMRWRTIVALVTAAVMACGYWLVWSDMDLTWRGSVLRWTLSASVLTFGIIGISLAVFLFNILRLFRTTMSASLGRTIHTGLLIMLTWLVLGVMIIATAQALSVLAQVLLSIE